jgi:hypothetical protein
MSAPKTRPALPAIALPLPEAAAALGIGESLFRKEVAPFVRCIRLGRARLYAVADLEAWAQRAASFTLEPDERGA